jgi:hypothetical protein
MKAGMIMAVITILFLLSQNIFAGDLVLVLEGEFDGYLELIEDIDGDGKCELEDSSCIYDLAGTQKYTFPGLNIPNIFELTEYFTTSLIDMNGDGVKDLILTDTNRIVIYDFIHQSNIYEIFEPSATDMECRYLGDIDNDAVIELMVRIHYYYDSIKTRIYSTGVLVSCV